MKLVMTAISALNLTLQTRIMSMQPNTDLTLLRVYQKHKTDNNSIACSSSLRVYKIPLQSLCVFIGSYNLTYVKEKIIASNYSLEVVHAFSTIHPMHLKLACSRRMARLINLVRQYQISFYISIPAYSTSTDTFHISLSHPLQVFHQSSMSGLHFLLELVPYFETRGLIVLFLHD